MVSTFAYGKSCASAVAFIFAMHRLENEEFSKFNPQKYNRVQVAARSVPKGNLRTCHGDRAHISVPPPTSGRFASKVITAEENGVFQVARRRCGDAVGGLPLGKC